MQFFKVEGLIADENWAEKCDDRRSLREKVRKIAIQSNAFNQKQKKKAQTSKEKSNLGKQILLKQEEIKTEKLRLFVWKQT